MSSRTSDRKVRKTVTLSPQSTKFLEKVRKERKAKSTSAALDEVLREAEAAQRLQAYGAEVIAYYDSATEEDMAEERAWGEFAERSFVADD